MNGDIWRLPSGETGPEVNRQDIAGVVHVEILLANAPWRDKVVQVPLSDLVLVPNGLTRYGGERGGRG